MTLVKVVLSYFGAQGLNSGHQVYMEELLAPELSLQFISLLLLLVSLRWVISYVSLKQLESSVRKELQLTKCFCNICRQICRAFS